MKRWMGVCLLSVCVSILAVSFSSASPFLPFFQASNLVLHLEMEGNANDSSIVGNDGTAGNVTWSGTSVLGTQSASFNGTTSVVTVPNHAIYNATTFTVCFWINTSSTFPGLGGVMAERVTPLTGIPGWDIAQMPTTDANPGSILVAGWRNDGTPAFSIQSTANLADGQWHHVAVVMSNVAGAINRLYIDGTQEGFDDTFGVWENLIQPILLGNTQDPDYYEPWQGLMDDFRLYNLGLTPTQIVTIYEEGIYSVNIEATDPDASEEGPDTGTFTITRGGGNTAAALTVDFTVGGTATSGTDYAGLGTQATIAAGSTTTTVTVTPVDDATGEPDETVIVTLVDGASYNLGTDSTATVTIVDNDPVVSVAATDSRAKEPNNTGTFTITRSGITTNPLVVGYTITGTATPGTDYQALTGTATIAAGSSTAAVLVTPIADLLLETTETVILTLSAGAGYELGTPVSATVNLRDESASDGGGGDDRTYRDFLCSAESGREGALPFVLLLPVLLLLTVVCRRRW